MAVEDKYVDANTAAGLIQNSAKVSGQQVNEVVITEEIAAADDDGSKYRLIKGLTGNEIFTEIKALADSITSGDDYDLGIYLSNLGAVKNVNAFADDIDFSSGFARGSEQNMLVDVAIEDVQKKVYELAGDSAPAAGGYDLVLTGNTVGSVAGTISFNVRWIQG